MSTILVPVYAGEDILASQLDQLIDPIIGLEQGLTFWGGTTSGSANAHTLTTTPAMTPLNAGQIVTFLPGFANTGATTLNVGTGVKPLLANGLALVSGILAPGVLQAAVFDGTSWHLLGGRGITSISGGGGAGNSFFGPAIGQATWIAVGGSSSQVTVDTSNFTILPAGTNPNIIPGTGIGKGYWYEYEPVFICPAGTVSVELSIEWYRAMGNPVSAPCTGRILKYQSSVLGTTFNYDTSIYAGVAGSDFQQVAYADSNGVIPHKILNSGRTASAPGDVWSTCGLGDGYMELVSFSIIAYGA